MDLSCCFGRRLSGRSGQAVWLVQFHLISEKCKVFDAIWQAFVLFGTNA